MSKISVTGLDLAKTVFQLHGVDADGEVVVRKQRMKGKITANQKNEINAGI
jgi:transposase